MGIDIMTYRARIGTFKHGSGQDVVTQNVFVDIPSFRRIIIGEILGVLVLIMTLLDTRLLIKHHHEVENTIQGTWDRCHVADYLMPLTLHSITEIVGYCLLISVVLPGLRSSYTGKLDLNSPDVNRNYKCNGSVIKDFRESKITKSINAVLVIGSVSFIGMLLLMAGVESNPGPGEGKDTCESELETDVHPLLKRLGLVKYYPGKIKVFDVISIAQENIMSLEGRNDEKLPWILLRKVMSMNENAFCLDDPTERKEQDADILSTDEESTDEDSTDEDHSLEKYKHLENKINYLDVFLVVYQCCSPMLQQRLCQKMFLCKFAFPFMFTPLSHKTPVVTMWPLRSLVVETSSKEKSVREYDALELPTKCIAFCRIGRPEISKSQLLNIFVADERSKTFFHHDSQSGYVSKSVSIKYIETFLLLKSGTDRDQFDDTTMVMNMRGCIRTFDKPSLTFMSSFVDIASVFIQKGDIIKYKSKLKDLTSLFKTIIIIIVGSSKAKNLNSVLEDLKSNASTYHECTVSFVRTYDVKAKKLKSDVSITREMVDNIKKQTQQQYAKSFETRLQECTREQIYTDEEVEGCEYGKMKAIEFSKNINLHANFLSLKTKLTPIQSTVARNLGTLLKELKREKDTNEQEKRREKINAARKEVESNITDIIKHILMVLCDNVSVEQLEYFLAWLEFHISRRSRHHLSELKQEHKQAWAIFQKQKHDDPQNMEDEKKQIESVEARVDAASFSVEHLFREIGLIYDTVCELRVSESILNIPSAETVASVIGKLMLNGRQFELIDSDSFYLQVKWLSKIYDSLHHQIQHRKVMTISVLGIQSSGKSTLLNTMFGALFTTGSGRCTRGIHAQLIPVHEDFLLEQKLDYHYVLILDTEGLRSTEVMHQSLEHDNELATLITGLGNTTIVNVMGENTQEIKDILQIVAHAFLRIKLVNEHIALHNRCILVQQNITAIAASDNLSDGLNKFVTNLDEMTQDAAMCEGLDNIRTFSDVINFDVPADVCHLPNVWHGNPPFARVNESYSGEANTINHKIFKQCPDSTCSTYKTLSQFICQTNDLWQGVLNENFVFSFKNSLERRAYLEMDEFIQTMLWEIELSLTRTMHDQVQNKFSNCQSLDEIETSDNEVNSLFYSAINEKKVEAENELTKYFETSENRTIIAQWNESQRGCIQRFFEKMNTLLKGNIRNERNKIKTKLSFHENKRQCGQALHQQTLKYSENNDVRNMTDQQVNNLFEKFWTNNFGTDDPNKDADLSNLDKYFRECLFDIHKTHQPTLNSILEQMKWDDHTEQQSHTVLSFERAGIDKHDMFSDKYVTLFERVEQCIKALLVLLTKEVETMCENDDHISESNVRVLLYGLREKELSMLSNENLKVKEQFYIKLNVHASMYAKQIFEEHNKINRQTLCSRFNSYKQEQKCLFKECLECRQIEDSVAEHIAHVISKHIETESKTQMYIETQNILHGILPRTKNRLIIEICSDMVDANEFGKIMSYIESPFETACKWLEQKSLHILFEEDNFAEYCLRVIDNLFSKVVKSLNSMQETNDEITTTEFVEGFGFNLNQNKLNIPVTDFASVLNWHLSNVNVKIVCNKIDAKLADDIAVIKTSFRAYTKSTVWWEGKSPFLVLFQRIWGCPEVCPYCNEPCEKSTESHDVDHTCVQHRPQCCNGIKTSIINQARPETCNFLVQSDRIHTCDVFKNKCNDEKLNCKVGRHKYRKYREVLKNWHILPSSDMHDSSKFWLWFAGKFKKELSEKYSYETDEIPDAWSNISAEDAKESLRTTYA